MREIVLDTETTGLDPIDGDRIVEIGCIELINGVQTGRFFHAYLNPQRAMPLEAFKVHGLSDAFLSDKPLFSAVADAFLAFIGDSPLVAHNIAFDIKFINYELKRIKRPVIAPDRLVDTLALARERHAGANNSLDALCRRYGVSNARRVKHGALLDAEILSEVYIELKGGRQTSLFADDIAGAQELIARPSAKPRPIPLPSRLDADTLSAHAQFIATIPDAVWSKYGT